MEITIVIPSREAENEKTTLCSLSKQTFTSFDIVIVKDTNRKGAPWARNEGFKKVYTPYVLFSDNDIAWESDALENLYNSLVNSNGSYSYGWYLLEGEAKCNIPFDPMILKKKNFISTMSLIRTADFPGFDENVKRLQDWDVWLTMLEMNKTGVYCDKKIFETLKRTGITFDGDIDWETANEIVKKKHKL